MVLWPVHLPALSYHAQQVKGISAYNHTNNRLNICDTNNHHISILNSDLTFHGSFGRQRSQAGQFNNSYRISVGSQL